MLSVLCALNFVFIALVVKRGDVVKELKELQAQTEPIMASFQDTEFNNQIQNARFGILLYSCSFPGSAKNYMSQ